MWDHPSHFPLAAWSALSGWAGQAVAGAHWHRGLAGHSASALDLSRADYSPPTRAISKTAAGRSSVVLGYVVLVYLIFFLVYTPIDTDYVRGVEGRYFVIALPVAAVFIAGLVNRELPRGMPAAIAIAGSIIAGITTVEAVLRAHW
jgi:hypothetical protein